MDHEFPHTDESIGLVQGDSAEGGKYAGGKTSWVRVKDLSVFANNKPKLYIDKIEPNDIFQGGLGDCWLMAAIACVSE